MPQNIDSNFDALVEVYADTEVQRLIWCDGLREFAYETLVAQYEKMTEKELIEHVAEMGDEEIVEQIYGNYPPQETEGDYTLKRGESIVL